MKFNVRVSVNDQTRVFNVAIDSNRTKQEVLRSLVTISSRCAPKYCKVEVGLGCKRHRGKALSLLDLVAELNNLHFYHYVEMEREVEKFVPLETFYKKPFSVEYADYIGATFFNDINEKMITDVFTALDEVVPYTLHIAKSGSYYCWGKLTMRVINVSKFTSAPQYRYQLCRCDTVVEKYKIKEEY